MELTIFTPTYNRAYILENLYRSLQRQTDIRFEWLIIDDGSQDDTDRLVADWQKESNTFTIRYLKVENGGKCRAINKALDLANGQLFFVVDSDDYLTDDAVEVILKTEETMQGETNLCGILANRGTAKNHTPNHLINKSYQDLSMLNRYPDYGDIYLDGERADIWYTKIHRKYRYPEFEGEKFITEAVVWNRMAVDGYKVRIIDDVIWIHEYLDDGLTRRGIQLFYENPLGYWNWLSEKDEAMKVSPMKKIKTYWAFYRELNQRISSSEIRKILQLPDFVIYVFSRLDKIKNRS